MKIESNNLISSQQEQLLQDAIVQPFNLGKYTKLEDLSKEKNIDVEILPDVKQKFVPKELEDLAKQIQEELGKLNQDKHPTDEWTVNEVDSKKRLNAELDRIQNLGKMLILGEWINKSKKIVLYPNAMKQVDAAKFDDLLVTTLVHEFMHVYFNRDSKRERLPYILQVEEPLAEFGMLLYMIDTNHPQESWAFQMVASKNTCYKFGADIMNAYKKDESIRMYLECYKVNIESPCPRICGVEDILIPVGNGALALDETTPITTPTITNHAPSPAASMTNWTSQNLPFANNGSVAEIATWDLVNQQNTLHFCIPSFQRGYRWDEKQVKDLCEDLQEFINSTEDKYYLQPLVVNPDTWLEPNTWNSIAVWSVLDGQQRLTTMLLLLKCICELGNQLCPLYDIHYSHRPTLNFGRMTYATGSAGAHLPNPLDNLDSYYVSEAKRVILNWYNALQPGEKQDLERCLLSAPSRSQKKEVKFIWYNMAYAPNPSTLSSLQLFNRLNGGKIGLTGAELIKSLFFLGLKSCGAASYSSFNTDSFVMEWDEMSKGFQDELFWGFLSSKKDKKMQTRMDLLFNTIKGVDGKEIDAAYRMYQDDFNKRVFSSTSPSTSAAELYSMWKEVRLMYDLMMRWYQNVDTFNYIGYIVTSGIPINTIINALGAKGYSVKNLQEYIKGQSVPNISTSSIDMLTYSSNKKDIRRLLLLFNVETYRKHGMRFPFNLYIAGKWDLEHVNSQTENTIEDPQERMSWIENQAIECLSHEDPNDTIAAKLRGDGITLLNNLQAAGGKGFVRDFETYRTDVTQYYSDGSKVQKDGIDNLVLLNSSINRKYQNALYPSKRLTVTTCDQMGEFIPLCTRYLFLKYYSRGINANRLNMMRWNQQDQNDYMEAIKQTLYPIIK